jgi:glycosyltransferase involved in cell wall biosynthesis
MAAGRPVVNTRIDSGVPFVSIDGVTGITVPPREPEALAAAITRLLDNRELRARYGAAAARRVREEFSLETMVARTLTLYDEILSGGASALSDPPRKMLARKMLAL